jgi:hypothetical protein
MTDEQPTTHSEHMEELREKAVDIRGALEVLIKCKEAGNLKQVAYWVGKVSHDVGALCRECLGEELLKEMSKKGKIII